MENIKLFDLNKFEILTETGWSDFKGIKRKSVNNTLIIQTTTKKLQCTYDHRIKTLHEFIEAKSLKVKDKVFTNTGYDAVVSIHSVYKKVYVYDVIDVENDHQYYTNGIISHNCEFQGSSGTLIEGSKLKALVPKDPLVEKNGLRLYEEFQKGHQYVCVVDVSRGKGLDYSAFSILDVTAMPYRQVCSFKDNLVTPIEYAEILYRAGKRFGECAILVEVNDIGQQVSEVLHYDYEYENILYTESAGKAGKRISSGFGARADPGIRTTKTVKAIGCNMLKLMVEQDQLIINDMSTISELSTFSRKGTSYEAEPGCNDDLVMTLVLFGWLSDQQYFKDITDINTLAQLRQRSEEEMMNELTPFGFYDNGVSEPEEEYIVQGGDVWRVNSDIGTLY